nr:alpha/beta fold hydrolase [Gemmatimonadaceae bacterium]
LGDSADRAVSIYLPPGYSASRARRFPVVYLLHGFGADNYTTWIAGRLQNLNVRVSMDSLIAAGKVGEMIIVMPSARNRYDGSFYANSPVTGNWEDFIVRDLVGFVDRHFRTIRSREARGLGGFSMGGYGALRLGMRHPETFAAIYALSPCCLDPIRMESGGMKKTWASTIALRDTSQIRTAGFNSNLVLALAAVYSPDTTRAPFFVNYPFRINGDSLVPEPLTVAKWKSVVSEIPEYAANLRRMKIGFEAGRSDGFADIPRNVTDLDRALTGLGIPHRYEIFEGTHGNRFRKRLEEVALPFFSANLAGARPKPPTRAGIR